MKPYSSPGCLFREVGYSLQMSVAGDPPQRGCPLIAYRLQKGNNPIQPAKMVDDP